MQRVFIGIPVDKQTQQLINELLKPVRKISTDIRWVPENNRHLTLAFLGDRPESDINSLLRVFDETYQQKSRFQYCLSALTRFPSAAGRILALREIMKDQVACFPNLLVIVFIKILQ